MATTQIIRQARERMTYVHLKFVDPTVQQRVRDGNLSLAEAVRVVHRMPPALEPCPLRPTHHAKGRK